MALSPVSNRPTYRAPPPPASQDLRTKAAPESSPVIPSLNQNGSKACASRQCDSFDKGGASGKNSSAQGMKGIEQALEHLVDAMKELVQDLGEALQGKQGAQGGGAGGAQQSQGGGAGGAQQSQGTGGSSQAQQSQGAGGSSQAQQSQGAGGSSQSQQSQGAGGSSQSQQSQGTHGDDQVPDLGDKPTTTGKSDKVNSLMAPDQATADAEIKKQYNDWKDKYVTSEGTGGPDQLRVKRPENNNDTVSEGIGYGMMMAAQTGDKKTFDGLWNYAKGHLDEHGLMDWKIDSNNKVMGDGHGGATDADEDMAMALVTADKKFGGYKEDATKMIGNIKEHEVEKGTNVLKPGTNFGGSDITNPSYFAPAYYKAFGEYTGDKSWDKVADKSYEILDNISKQPGFKDTGLVPDWCKADGTPAADRPNAYQYSYDAARTPLRIGTDAAWNGDPRATAFLDKQNAFWKKQGGYDNIKAGYDANGNATAGYKNSTFTSTSAAGAITEKDAATRGQAWDATVNSKDGGYFGDSLRVLSLMQMGNRFDKP